MKFSPELLKLSLISAPSAKSTLGLAAGEVFWPQDAGPTDSYEFMPIRQSKVRILRTAHRLRKICA